jgi:hypothetical protein
MCNICKIPLSQRTKKLALYVELTQAKKTPYWSSNLARLRKVARRACNHRAADLEAYRTAVREYDRALSREERSSYKHMTSTVEGIQPAARLHKILSKDETYQMGNLRLPSGNSTTTDQEVAAHLLETHFPGSLPFSSDKDLEPESGPPSNEDWTEAAKIVTEDKVKWAVEVWKVLVPSRQREKTEFFLLF